MAAAHSSGELSIVSVVYEGYLTGREEKLIKELKISFPVLVAGSQFFEDLEIEAYPTAFLVDSSGVAVKKIVGPLDESTRRKLADETLDMRRAQ